MRRTDTRSRRPLTPAPPGDPHPGEHGGEPAPPPVAARLARVADPAAFQVRRALAREVEQRGHLSGREPVVAAALEYERPPRPTINRALLMAHRGFAGREGAAVADGDREEPTRGPVVCPLRSGPS